MSNQTNSYSSPLSNEMAQNIDNLNLPIIQKHHIRILAHCLEVLKEIANDNISFFEEEDLLREWCERQSQEFQDERFNQILYEQMSSAAKKLNAFSRHIKKNFQELDLKDLIFLVEQNSAN